MSDNTFFTVFGVVFGIVFVLALAFILLTFVRIFRGRQKLRDMGIDPTTVGPEALHNLSEAAARAAQSPEDRLRELDRLRGQGLITAEEYDTKRADVLRGL